MNDVLRETLGMLVRQVWIDWAKEQPNPKPSWLVPWEGLSEPDREVDRRIGERLFRDGLAFAAAEYAPQTAEARFADKDSFIRYVAFKVNPARLKEGLACISDSHANVCYDLITDRRYRRG